MTAKPKKTSKDSIYIDIEDEITSVIEKVKASGSKVVALVLPKRYGTLQSAINLKLLKRGSVSAQKSIVLITSDATVVSLAGAIGIHVARTLQSRPKVPVVSKQDDSDITIESQVEGAAIESDTKLDPSAPIGKLADGPIATETDETIEVGDHEPLDAKKISKLDKKKSKNEKLDKKLKIPNFNKFRVKIIIAAVLLMLLGAGWYLGANVLPAATIIISTNTSKIDASIDFNADSSLEELDLDENNVPAYRLEIKKASTEKVPTTGELDEGAKANGFMTLTNCIPFDGGFTVPVGTVFSAGGLNFISTESAEIPPSSYTGSSCVTAGVDTPVVADGAGSKYNLTSRKYSVPDDYTSNNGSMQANGSDMAGGTTILVKVVAQADIDAAKQQALDKLSEDSLTDITGLFTADQAIALAGSLENEKPTLQQDLGIGEKTSEVSISVSVTYYMYGIKRDHLTKLIEKNIIDKIDTTNQSVQNTGLDEADIRINNSSKEGVYSVSINTTAIAGPSLDVGAIASEVAGKKLGETNSNISSRPGITNVDIKYSPFWVLSTPDKTEKITIILVESSKND
jgi:hypothetical protein